MRKALIGFLTAATMATPVAAFAQSSDGGLIGQARRVQDRAERQEQRAARREQRQEQRQQQRAERRQETRIERPTPQREDRAANWPGQRQRVNQILTEQARQERREERREDRLDRREERRDDRPTDRLDRRQDRLERREDRLERRRDRLEDLPRTDRRDQRLDRLERRDDRIDRRQDRLERREDRREWRRDWRNDRRYDWTRWRSTYPSLYRPGRYYAPGWGHRYSRFSIGLRLGSPFYSSRYWINDPWQYRLPPAYPGTRWVRYYDDVLLVDLYTGEVLDVIYNFFW